MKKKATEPEPAADADMRDEYDLSSSKGVRGNHYKAMQAGYTITIHNSDGSTIVREVKPAELEHETN